MPPIDPPLPTSDIPQADSPGLMLELLRRVADGTPTDPTELGLQARRIAYHRHGLRVLGLVTDGGAATDQGRHILIADPADARAQLRQAFEASQVGRAWLVWAGAACLDSVDPESAARFLSERTLLSGETIARRASTLRRWHAWLADGALPLAWAGVSAPVDAGDVDDVFGEPAPASLPAPTVDVETSPIEIASGSSNECEPLDNGACDEEGSAGGGEVVQEGGGSAQSDVNEGATCPTPRTTGAGNGRTPRAPTVDRPERHVVGPAVATAWLATELAQERRRLLEALARRQSTFLVEAVESTTSAAEDGDPSESGHRDVRRAAVAARLRGTLERLAHTADPKAREFVTRRLAEEALDVEPGMRVEDRLIREAGEDVPEVRAAGRRISDLARQLALLQLRLVKSEASRPRYRGRGFDEDELFQEGVVGLLKAARKFDLRRGSTFATVAHWWIMASIERALTERGGTIRIPAHAHEQMRRLQGMLGSWSRDRGHLPDLSAIAAELNVSEARASELLALVRGGVDVSTSLDALVDDGSGARVGDLVPDPRLVDADEAAGQAMALDRIGEVLPRLPDRLRRVLSLRFGLEDGTPHTLAEIGKKFDLSRERIRQLELSALAELRRALHVGGAEKDAATARVANRPTTDEAPRTRPGASGDPPGADSAPAVTEEEVSLPADATVPLDHGTLGRFAKASGRRGIPVATTQRRLEVLDLARRRLGGEPSIEELQRWAAGQPTAANLAITSFLRCVETEGLARIGGRPARSVPPDVALVAAPTSHVPNVEDDEDEDTVEVSAGARAVPRSPGLATLVEALHGLAMDLRDRGGALWVFLPRPPSSVPSEWRWSWQRRRGDKGVWTNAVGPAAALITTLANRLVRSDPELARELVKGRRG